MGEAITSSSEARSLPAAGGAEGVRGRGELIPCCYPETRDGIFHEGAYQFIGLISDFRGWSRTLCTADSAFRKIS